MNSIRASLERNPSTAMDEAPASTPAVDMPSVTWPRRRGLWHRLPISGKLALGVILLIALVAILAPVLALPDPNVGVAAHRLRGIGSPGHLLGTDGQGRDLLSRMIWGARPSLLTGLIPVLISTTLGTSIGITTGMAGRRLNAVVMRVLDVFYAFPAILLAIAVATVLGSGVSNAILALSIILIPPIARLAEAETRRVRTLDFMEAAEASGAGPLAIARRQVLPNVGPPILVYCTALIGLSIVYAAGLSFLGIGLRPPKAEWGLMISDLTQFMFTKPELAIVPAAAILVVSVAFSVLGDGLRDAFDVKLGAHQ